MSGEKESGTHWKAMAGKALGALQRHWLLALAMVVLSLLAGVLISAHTTPQYRTRASLLVEPRRGHIIKDAEFAFVNLREEVEALRTLARSRPVLDGTNLLLRDRKLECAESKGIELDARILLSPAISTIRSEGKLLVLEVEHPDAEVSAWLSNAWAQAIEDDANMRETYTKDYTGKFYQEVLPTKGEEWRKQQKELFDFMRENRYDPNDNGLRSQHEALYQKLTESRLRKEGLLGEQKLWAENAGKPELLAQSGRARRNPAAMAYENLLREAKQRLAEAAERYAPDSPALLRQQARVAEIKSMHEAALAAIADEIRVEILAADAEYAWLNQEFVKFAELNGELRNLGMRYTELAMKADVARKTYEDAIGRLADAELTKEVKFSYVRRWEQASPPALPYRPDWAGNLFLSLLLGLLLAAAATYLREMLDDSVRSSAHLEARLGVEVLGAVPLLERKLRGEEAAMLSRSRPRTPFLESLRTLRHSLAVAYSGKDGLAPLILITSPGEGEGKSFLSCNLAILFAQSGKKTLLVDADIRKATLSRTLDLVKLPGLAALAEQPATELSSILTSAGVEGLSVIPAGTTGQAHPHLFESPAFLRLLEQARRQFEVVLLDSAPLLMVADACSLASVSSVVLLVCRGRITRLAHIEQAADALERAHAKEVAYLVNGVEPSDAQAEGYGYGYAYYNRYGSSESHAPVSSAKAAG